MPGLQLLPFLRFWGKFNKKWGMNSPRLGLMYGLMKVRFHLYWNMVTLHLSLKKDTEVLKKITDQWVCCLSSPKFSKSHCTTKYLLSWISFCQNTKVALDTQHYLLLCWRSGRKQLTRKIFLVLFLLISQKHSTVYRMILLLLNGYGFSLILFWFGLTLALQ